MASLISETTQKVFTPETLRAAAKQSERCLVVPVRLRRAIKKYLREQEDPYMRRKVLRLSESFSEIKKVNLHLTADTLKELVEDPLKSMEQSKRWKIKSAYGDIGLTYRDDETAAYVASRMPAVYSACYRVLSEARVQLSGGQWAVREVWPKSMEKVNIVEPSQSMQRAGRSLIQDLKNLPIIHSYTNLQGLAKDVRKSEREHDLVIASYVLGEIPSLKDRITIVRQLWNLTRDVLVLIEPGTPHGSNIISQMRSHLLWMEKRKCRKAKVNKEESKDLIDLRSGVFIVAPCPHDGRCPLENSGKYCHFVQRLQRTSSQRAYKRSKGDPLRGFEDEKFSYVAFRRGQRPRESWPLDGMKFETLKEQRAKRNPEDLEVDYEDLVDMEETGDIVPYEEADPSAYDSDVMETDIVNDDENLSEETVHANLGGGWGRIIFAPVRRGRQVQMNICRPTNIDASEGSFDREVVTQSKNPTLHFQARRSFWGDLWPLGSNETSEV
ncbi:Cytochrome c oxidase assembly protein CtaG/Cox11 [Corchorus olitorius]|uniref:Cytochrome c oxidase assembly protein CtaG/Cox11 n=1 Tax=Corchorus olitorius TaxID=93759 RepID=A0A1R3K704_9ROSI|nr:Cytochrome c oxidase assembly protein CtaG/Cox11 [Corchorus olitorius]